MSVEAKTPETVGATVGATTGETAAENPVVTSAVTVEDHAAMGHDAETTATTAVHAGAEAHAVPAALGLDATMWVALAMLLVIGLAIWKKVPAMVGSMLDKQIAGIKDQLDQATNLRKEAEAIKADYEAKAKQAAVDAEAMKAHAEEEAKAIIAKAKTDATTLIARRAQSAEDKIAAAERAAIADVRAHAASVAAIAAEALILKHHDGKADASLIDETISKLN